MRFAAGSMRKARQGSDASSSRSASTGRTMVRKALPSRRSSAASIFICNALSVAARAPNTTFPLDSSVFTSVKPAASNAFFTSGIFAFVGITPRRNAA